MEVCVETVLSAERAAQGGASRLELCSALSEGGLTPSPGLLHAVKSHVDIPVFVMLRPRAGNFTYTHAEMQAVLHDARILAETGADGFVFGALTSQGKIDTESCTKLLDFTKCVTFHRAYDWSVSPFDALEQIIELGFERVLSSGQEKTAYEGIPMLKNMIEKTQGRISVMPGAGIHCGNVEGILRQTGAREFHASAREKELTSVFRNTRCSMGTQDEQELTTSVKLVREMVAIYKKLYP